MTNRREFLSTVIGGTAVLSFSGTAPDVLLQTAQAGEKKNSERVLVVVQMSGGNDGLNTVVPHSHSVYQQNRKKLRIASSDVLSIDDKYGFHPNLKGFASLLEDGDLGIVPSVGYAKPNRSHFESMDIWHTCRRKAEPREVGWLGTLLEKSSNDESKNGLSGMHIGAGKQPLAMVARDLRFPSVTSLDRFRLNTKGNEQLGRVLERALAEPKKEDNDLLGFLSSSTQSAMSANKRLEKVREAKDTSGAYPESPLGRKLATIGRLIKADMPTRVYYVTIDGFDTHARQQNSHAALLRQVGDAVTAFTRDMSAAGQGKRTLVVAFSEFGRRVAENASEGTDHGTAGPLFLAGESVKSGFLGSHSDLSKLDEGDLRFRTDFRSVYASIIEDWFGFADSESILGGRYTKLRSVLTS